MYGGEVERVRAEVAELDLQSERIRRVLRCAITEADRSAAVLIFALVEDLMLDAFKKNLSDEYIKGGWDEITSGNGLLSTANDRLSLLALLDWIKPSTYSDLRLLKSIRNRFAHHADVGGFDDKNIRSWLGSMNPIEKSILKSIDDIHEDTIHTLNARQTFLMRATMVVTELVSNLAIGPKARTSKVAPGHVSSNWATCPENLREIHRVAAEIVLEVLGEPPSQGSRLASAPT